MNLEGAENALSLLNKTCALAIITGVSYLLHTALSLSREDSHGVV